MPYFKNNNMIDIIWVNLKELLNVKLLYFTYLKLWAILKKSISKTMILFYTFFTNFSYINCNSKTLWDLRNKLKVWNFLSSAFCAIVLASKRQSTCWASLSIVHPSLTFTISSSCFEFCNNKSLLLHPCKVQRIC